MGKSLRNVVTPDEMCAGLRRRHVPALRDVDWARRRPRAPGRPATSSARTASCSASASTVGVPDDKFGEAITAVVEPAPGVELDAAAVIAHVKSKLASYKAPKHVITIDTIGRAANGKVDYKRLKALGRRPPRDCPSAP